MNELLRRALRARTIAILATLSVVVGALFSPPPVAAQTPPTPGECDEIITVDQLQARLDAGPVTGTGYTVARGRTVETFDVEVLGVLKDGVAPGRDMIVIDTSGSLIDNAGGIWFGMSGSPVYTDDGKLIGAVAFGFSFGPSSTAGVTPAEDMLKVLGYPPTGGTTSARAFAPKKVFLSRQMRARIAREEGTTASEVEKSMTWLKIPISLSGVSALNGRLDKLRKRAAKKDLPFVIPRFATSSASADGASGTAVPGESFAAALSYGDITFAGIGTTTYVCEGQALAFGHPFFFNGRTLLGASAADALTIVDDPVFGPFKLAEVAEPLGVVDQDRLAAIRAVLGRQIPTAPVTQDTVALDTGATRTGARTDVVKGTSDDFPFIAWLHSFANIDSVFDEIDEGSAKISWTITGKKTGSNEPWALVRTNRWISNFDISWGSTFELLDWLTLLQFQDLEPIELTGVDINVDVEETIRRYRIHKVLWSKNGRRFRDVSRMSARPGQTIHAKVRLRASDDAPKKVVKMKFKIPRKARRDGRIRVSGGGGGLGSDIFCVFFGDCPGGSAKSFDALLNKLESQSRNDDLVGRMRIGRRQSEIRRRQGKVVRGRDALRVVIKRG